MMDARRYLEADRVMVLNRIAANKFRLIAAEASIARREASYLRADATNLRLRRSLWIRVERAYDAALGARSDLGADLARLEWLGLSSAVDGIRESILDEVARAKARASGRSNTEATRDRHGGRG